MKIIHVDIGDYAQMTGYIHEPSREMGNVKSFPGILVLPGGAFRVCSEREGEPVAMAFFAEGYSTFVLDYTTISKKPDAVIGDPISDCIAALAWIRTHTEELYLKNGQLGMIGFSGGGHLAVAVSASGPERPDLLLLGYPGILHSDIRALESPNLVEQVDGKMPPVFIFSTHDDTIDPPKHALALVQRLDHENVPFELHIFRHGVHGLSLGKALTSSGNQDFVNDRFTQWFPLAVQWLKEMWGDFTVYGVNDGRAGRFNIDKPFSLLMAHDAASAVVRQFIPLIDKMIVEHSELKNVTVRAFIEWGYPLPQMETERLDKALLML